MAVLIACILLGLILAVLFRNSPRHREAVARRAADNQRRREQMKGHRERIPKIYNKDHMRELRAEHGYMGAAKAAHEEYVGRR